MKLIKKDIGYKANSNSQILTQQSSANAVKYKNNYTYKLRDENGKAYTIKFF